MNISALTKRYTDVYINRKNNPYNSNFTCDQIF